MNLIGKVIAIAITGLIVYSVVGTSGNVDEIKERAPAEIEDRGWEVLRYEGFQYGAFSKHGGYAWYHVKDMGQKNIYYRVRVAMWGGELQYYYGEPERLSRFDIEIPTN
ncbi:MAG: hypothetical protein V3R67_08795 [Thermodesulfobacteriota bacterium]